MRHCYRIKILGLVGGIVFLFGQGISVGKLSSFKTVASRFPDLPGIPVAAKEGLPVHTVTVREFFDMCRERESFCRMLPSARRETGKKY